MSTSTTTPLTLTPEERDLILTLRTENHNDVVTAHPVYVELLACCNRDVAQAMKSLSRANNLLTHLNSQTVAAE